MATREQAEDMLHDLIFAYDDSCNFPKKPDYYDDYVKQRERIIEALGSFPATGAKYHEGLAIDELTKEREVYRTRWLASEVDLRLAREELVQMQSAHGQSTGE